MFKDATICQLLLFSTALIKDEQWVYLVSNTGISIESIGIKKKHATERKILDVLKLDYLCFVLDIFSAATPIHMHQDDKQTGQQVCEETLV